MWLRRAFYAWLFPAAVVLPLWLFVGLIAFNGGAWALLWVLFLAIPSILIGQVVLTLLVRARPTARAERAVSWWDVAGFGVWHALTISLGFFAQTWWFPVFLLTIAVGISLFWLTLWQLWREAQPSFATLRTARGVNYIPPQPSPPRPSEERAEVIIITETPRP